MAQPIRKKIQEEHPNLIKEEDIYTLLIDGGSLLYACPLQTAKQVVMVYIMVQYINFCFN